MIRNIILFSFISLLVCFWMRDDLTFRPAPRQELAAEPVQEATPTDPFAVQVGDHTYQVAPQYNYDLYGLVVSYRVHNTDFGIHHDWGDYLNVADVCVVWADNAAALDLTRFDFWNGEFTCNFKTTDSAAWQQFRGDQLSNNHLITENPYLRNEIAKLGIGDQIHISGMLASYKGDSGSSRGTSTVRTDTGNGACETIYVQRFERLYDYSSPWRYGMYASLLVLVLSLGIYLKMPHRARN